MSFTIHLVLNKVCLFIYINKQCSKCSEPSQSFAQVYVQSQKGVLFSGNATGVTRMTNSKTPVGERITEKNGISMFLLRKYSTLFTS